jgi:hypothetical protein
MNGTARAQAPLAAGDYLVPPNGIILYYQV